MSARVASGRSGRREAAAPEATMDRAFSTWLPVHAGLLTVLVVADPSSAAMTSPPSVHTLPATSQIERVVPVEPSREGTPPPRAQAPSEQAPRRAVPDVPAVLAVVPD